MSTFCAIVTVLALPISDCAEAAPIRVPDGDRAAFAYERPEPPAPPPPAPEPQTIIREVVKETIREVPVPAPALPPEPVSQPAPEPEIVIVEPPAPDPHAIRLAATQHTIGSAYAMRRGQRLAGITPDPAVMIEDVSVIPASFGPEVAADDPAADVPAFTPPDELGLPSDLASLADRDDAARYAEPGVTSSLPVDNARILAADRYIAGVLESSINTQVSGNGQGSIIIQTSRDIFGYHGRFILLPKGSRLICEYEAPKKIGETRIAISCNRVLSAGHRAEIYEVAAPVRDAQGRAGITGEVDNRFWNRYGTAFMLSAISAAVRGATASGVSDANRDRNDAITDEAGKELAERFGEITASVLQETVALQPVISIPQGTRVQIRPANDWYIRKIS